MPWRYSSEARDRVRVRLRARATVGRTVGVRVGVGVRVRPRAQQAEPHLAVRVEVRVEAHEAVAGGLQVDERRDARVVLRHEDVELEEAEAVRRLAALGVERVGRARDEHL